MSCAGIIISNCPYSVLDQISWLCIAEDFVRSKISGDFDHSDAYFVNDGYDKQIVNVQINELDSGQMVITDRGKLLQFLTIAEKASYKYIFLDIRFEKGQDTESDSALFAKIATMKNVLYANHSDIYKNSYGKEFPPVKIINPNTKLPKYAYNDYYTTAFNSNFSRYAYIQDGRTSVALRMYQDINGKSVKKEWLGYKNDGEWCENCPFVPIDRPLLIHIDDSSEEKAEEEYHNLGLILLSEPEELIKHMNDKIVVVGDFNEDTHDTYMGKVQGPYLTYLAYKYLADGKNNISIWFYFALTIVFYLIVRSKISKQKNRAWALIKKKISSIIPKKTHSILSKIWHLLSKPWRNFLLSFVTYSLILTLISVLLYVTFGKIFNIVFPALMLTLIDKVINSLRKEQQ